MVGNKVLEEVTTPLSDSSIIKELSLLKPKTVIEDKLSSMSEAALLRNWAKFHQIYQEMMDFKPSQELIDKFGREEMESTISRNASIGEIIDLRENLVLIKVSEESLDEGQNAGNAFLEKSKK